MLDFNDIPQKYVNDVKIFRPTSSTAGVGQQVWNKPRGCSMVYIFVLGGGGGGGGGEYDSSGSGGGGGGGGSSGQTTVLMPAALLPDRLYVLVGQGGAGATAPTATSTGGGGNGGTASAGIASYVFVQPLLTGAGVPTVNNVLAIANGGGAGGTGSNGGSGAAAGAAGAIATIGTMPLAGIGTYSLLAGQASTAGISTTPPTNITFPPTGLLVTAGGAGGGFSGTTGIAGASIIVPGVLTIPGGLADRSAALRSTSNGVDGFNILNDSSVLGFSTGGSGGGGSGSTTLFGGSGGIGGPGSGGGAGPNMLGGGTLPNPAPGAGGRGGHGLVIIISW